MGQACAFGGDSLQALRSNPLIVVKARFCNGCRIVSHDAGNRVIRGGFNGRTLLILIILLLLCFLLSSTVVVAPAPVDFVFVHVRGGDCFGCTTRYDHDYDYPGVSSVHLGFFRSSGSLLYCCFLIQESVLALLSESTYCIRTYAT